MIRQRKDGQGLVEYSVIVALVAIAVILVVTLLANTTTQVYSNVVCQVQGAGIFGTGACATPSAGDVSGLPGTINPGGYPGAVTADGPEAYWRLDEAGVQNGNVAVDMLGNDNGTYNTNGGSITSGITPSALTWPSGNNPTDATIRGTNINLMGGADMTPDNGLTAVQGSSARTIEVWFNNSNDTVAAGGTRQNIFEVGGSGPGNSMVIALVNGNCCTEGTAGFPSYSSQALEVSFATGGNNGYTVAIPKMNLADGHWHYLVVSLSGQTVNVYLDGVQPMGTVVTNSNLLRVVTTYDNLSQLQPFYLPFVPSTATTTLDWGGASLGVNNATDVPFVGQLDEAAIYNKALSANQVATHYTAGVGIVTPESVASGSYADATLNGDANNGCPTAQRTAATCGPVAYWRLGDNVTQSPVAADAAAGTANDPNGDPGNYTGGVGYNYFNGSGTTTVPIGAYAQNTTVPTGSGSANSMGLGSGDSSLNGVNNANGSGVRANTLPAMQGDNARSVKLWFQTSSTADVQTLIGERGYASGFSTAFVQDFNIQLYSAHAAGSAGPWGGAGGAPAGTTANGGLAINLGGGAGADIAWVPASANLADGHWHYLVVTLSGMYVQVYIDDVPTPGTAYGFGGFRVDSRWSTPLMTDILLGGSTPNTPTADITIGYDLTGGLGDWLNGGMEDVAIFNYVLSPQQVAWEWGRAHPSARCDSLNVVVAGNAYGGTIPGQPLPNGTTSTGTDAPVTAGATQRCDTVGSTMGLTVPLTGTVGSGRIVTTPISATNNTTNMALPADPNVVLADSYVTFYYGEEKQVRSGSPACYQGTVAQVLSGNMGQIPWSTGSPGDWVYCYPGGPNTPSPNADYAKGGFVNSATVPVTVTFYQGQILVDCTLTGSAGSVQDPRYFIKAVNGNGAQYPATPSTGIALAASQNGNLAAQTTQAGTNSTNPNFPASSTYSLSWGLTNMGLYSPGLNVLYGSICLPTPGPRNDSNSPGSRGNGDVVKGGECVTLAGLTDTVHAKVCPRNSDGSYKVDPDNDGDNDLGYGVDSSSPSDEIPYATWTEQLAPYIRINPGVATIGAGSNQPYNAVAYNINGTVIGAVANLTLTPVGANAANVTCNSTGSAVNGIVAHSCSSTLADTYTIQAAYGSETDLTTLIVTVDTANLVSLSISPPYAAIASGASETYTATGYDQYGNPVGDVTAATFFSVPGGVCNGGSGANGSGPGNAHCTPSAVAQDNTVTGTYAQTSYSATATLHVNPGSAASLNIVPSLSSVNAGSSQTYSVTSVDAFGNTITDVTGATTFVVTHTVGGASGGSCTGAVCTPSTTAGAYTVTATDGSLSVTASLTVTIAGSLTSISIAPTSSSITADQAQTYVATGTDAFGNTSNVTTSTTFTFTSGSGSCNGAICAVSLPGNYTVHASNGSQTATASLTVGVGPLHSITISPSSISIAAGGSQTYSAAGFDGSGNALGDVTSATTFSVPSGTCNGGTGSGGSGPGNTSCAPPTTSGTYTVTGNDSGFSATASLHVNAGSAASITLSPSSTSINAGQNQPYTAASTDSYGNVIADVTGSTSFSFTLGTGSCSGATCTPSTTAGDYTIQGVDGSMNATASLHVNSTGVMTSITISPAETSITVGGSQVYSATSFDTYGNPIGDVTTATTFSVPGGSCTSGSTPTCTPSHTASSYTVTGTDSGHSATAVLHVNAGTLASITVTVSPSTLTAGGNTTASAVGFDQYGNTLGDVSAASAFSFSAGSGSCAGGTGTGGTAPGNVTCTPSTVAMTDTIQGTDSGFSATADVHVNSGSAVSISLNPPSTTMTAGGGQGYSTTSYDSYGNPVGDVTGSTTLGITPDGSCTGTNCTASHSDSGGSHHTVTGTDGSMSATATLFVIPIGTLANIAISPSSASIASGGSQAYTAVGLDSFGNVITDVTSDTTFTVPGGTCTAGSGTHTCTPSTIASSYTVTGTDGAYSATAVLHVNSGAVASMVLVPQYASITAGSSQTYTAAGLDSYGNPSDITSATTFSVPSGTCNGGTGSGGSGPGNGNCTPSSTSGTYTVTGVDGAKSATATVAVNAPLDYFKFEGSAPFADSGSLNHPATDVLGNIQALQTSNNIIGDYITFPSVGTAYATFNSSGLPVSTAQTVEMWLKTTATTQQVLYLVGNGSSNSKVEIEINGCANGYIYINFGGTTMCAATKVNDGKWHLIDWTFDPTTPATYHVYVDGALVATQASTGLTINIAAWGGLATIGNGDEVNRYVGSLDDFAIYGTALSETQINLHLQASPSGTVGLANTTYSNAVLADNPTDYYRLADTSSPFADYGSGNHLATDQYSNLSYAQTGADGNGVTFAGSTRDIAFSTSSLPTTGPRTLEMWIKTNTGGDQGLFGYGNCGGTNQTFYVDDNGGNIYFNTGTSGWNFYANLNDNKWHQIAVSYDNTTGIVTIYKDGAFLGNVTIAAANVLNTRNDQVGNIGIRCSAGAYFTGSLDDVSIYGTALSSVQIGTHYQASRFAAVPTATTGDTYATAVKASSPAVYYRFGDGSYTYTNYGTANANILASSNQDNVTTATVAGDGAVDGSALGSFANNDSLTFDASVLPTGGAARTLEMWIKTSTGGDQGLFGYGGCGGTLQTFYVDDNGGYIHFVSGTSVYDWYANLNDNKWHQVAVSYDGNVVSVYKDGALMGNVGVGTLNTPQAVVATVGSRCGNGAGFAGSIDEVSVYATSLSAATVGAHYQASRLAAATQTATTYSGVVASNNPVLYYRFGESLYTYWNYGSGTNLLASASRDSVVTNSTTAVPPNSTTGLDGSALVFANNDYVNFDTSELPTGNSARTVEFWMKTTTGGEMSMFSYGANSDHQSFTVNDNGGYLQFRGNNTSPNVYANLNDGNWHQIAITYSYNATSTVGLLTFYKDGAQISNANVGNLLTPSGSLGYVGAGNLGNTWFTGSLDEVSVYGSALSAGAIFNHYNAVFAQTTQAATTYSTAVVANSPTVYYRFGETNFTYLNYGSATSAMATDNRDVATSVAGADGQAITFVNANADIVSFDASSLPTGNAARTMELWMKSGAGIGNAGLVSWGANSSYSLFSLLDDNGNLTVRTGGGHDVGFGYANLNDSRWHQLVVTYDGTTVIIYKDGAQFGTWNAGTLTTASGSTGTIGWEPYNGGYFTGSIDEVAIYPSVLSTAQVATQYQASQFAAGNQTATSYSGAVAAQSPLIYYRFGESRYTYLNYGSTTGAMATDTRDNVTSVAGADGNALAFVNATNDIVTFDASSLPSGHAARTVELWMYSGTCIGSAGLVSWGTNVSYSDFALQDDNCSITVRTGGGHDVGFGYANLGDSRWHQLVATYDGTTVIVYKDGAEFGTWSAGTLTTTVGSTGTIGWDPTSNVWFTGSIDEVAIYAGARSTAQIAADYQSSPLAAASQTATGYSTAIGGNSPAPTVYYRFGESRYTYLNYGSATGVMASDSRDNVTSVSGKTVQEGNALSFVNATNDIVTFDASSLPSGNAARTVEVWMKSGTSIGSAGLVAWGTNANRSEFALEDNSGQIVIRTNGNDIGLGSGGLNDNAWHLVTITYDGTTLIAYKDGVQDGTWTPGTLTTSGSSVGLIGYDPTGNAYFTGYIDEAAVYNAVLSPDTIASHYVAGTPGTNLYIVMSPGSSLVGTGIHQAYTATEYINGGGTVGTRNLSNLTIAPTSGGADTTAPFGCNVSDHTCWATTLGVYTVTGTYNGLTATSSYTVSSYVPGMTAYIFTGSSMSDVVTKEATLSNAVYTYHENTAGEPNYGNGNPNPPGYPGASNWGMVWTGSFVAPVTGTYYFQTYSDDGSNVYIDGTLALDNGFYGGGHGMQNGTIYPIVLTAGTTHTIQVLWVQGGGGWGINATWQVTPSGGSQTASAYLTDSSGSYTLGLYTNP